MFDTDFPDKVHITEDGFVLVEGSQRLDVNEWCATAPSAALRTRGMLVLPVIVEALACAASWEGSLLNFDIRAFFDEHITEAMEMSSDDPPLVYDAFTAMTLQEAFAWLQTHGFLAHRGNGDSYDYWLAAPAVSRG
jgi:hypothetical protein